MSTNAKRPTLAPPVDRIAQSAHATKNSRPVWLSADSLGLAVAVGATLITYGIFFVYPYSHMPLASFLATFGHANAAVWPMQLVWYMGALVIAGLALWPRWSLRRSTQLICLLAAAYFIWIGVAYFGVLSSSMHLAWLWAVVFILEAILLLVAGLVRHDLVISPRWDAASALGALFIGYALLAYPIIGILGEPPLSNLPVFGLAPCPTVIFGFGLLLWARPRPPSTCYPSSWHGACAPPQPIWQWALWRTWVCSWPE